MHPHREVRRGGDGNHVRPFHRQALAAAIGLVQLGLEQGSKVVLKVLQVRPHIEIEVLIAFRASRRRASERIPETTRTMGWPETFKESPHRRDIQRQPRRQGTNGKSRKNGEPGGARCHAPVDGAAPGSVSAKAPDRKAI